MMLRAVASIEQWASASHTSPFQLPHPDLTSLGHNGTIWTLPPNTPSSHLFRSHQSRFGRNWTFFVAASEVTLGVWKFGPACSVVGECVGYSGLIVAHLVHEATVHINSKNYRRVFEVVLDQTKALLASNEDIQKAIETITYDLGKPGSSVEPLFLLNYLPAASPNGQHGHVS
ncbi:hypothetical protein JAAARDRAFT_498206 [Jaapia argillacea MUCL 33604]|uniref:Uncharacterized protein n=1 Tax=Jaapia argillacea MUCL 33604 TaxID=933084 RepID=A0A067PL48_9AGAM|nr:hypothetical protein JAAARDRAFT_498206 [Jaapia argillacea MUCL 33604]